jgi:hypothetical protein
MVKMTLKGQLNIALLVSKFLTNELTKSEKSELDTWLDECADNRSRFEKWTNIPYLMGAAAEKKLEDPTSLSGPLGNKFERPEIFFTDKDLVPVMYD